MGIRRSDDENGAHGESTLSPAEVVMSVRVTAGFKTCPGCENTWLSRNELLGDPQVRLLGFQPVASGHEAGLFLFHHEKCGTTLALDLPSLGSLSRRPMLALSHCSAGVSTDYCLSKLGGGPCPLYCVCEFVAEVAGLIQAWPKEQPEV
jgi:hypothetical protein